MLPFGSSGEWNGMEGKRDHGIIWKHWFTAKVFSVGTRALGFLQKYLYTPSKTIKVALAIV
jgi:hypothetical protein